RSKNAVQPVVSLTFANPFGRVRRPQTPVQARRVPQRGGSEDRQMLSRRRSLGGGLPCATAPLVVLVCVAAICLPSPAPAQRWKSAGNADGDDRSVDRNGDTDDPAATSPQPAAAGDVVVNPSGTAGRALPPPVFGSEGDVDEHVHVRQGDTLDHILL